MGGRCRPVTRERDLRVRGARGQRTLRRGRETSLSVGPGEFVSVVGPTGCGKSTLLNVAAGLLAPSSGRALVHGVPLSGINARAGYMFQSDALMPWRNALDNVTAGLEFHGSAGRMRRRRRANGSRA